MLNQRQYKKLGIILLLLSANSAFSIPCDEKKYTQPPDIGSNGELVSSSYITCDCDSQQSGTESQTYKKSKLKNCGGCTRKYDEMGEHCVVPDTDPWTDCPADNCIQGQEFDVTNKVLTRSVACGTATYNVGIGGSFNYGLTADINAGKDFLTAIGLIGVGGSFQFNGSGVLQADANGNVELCFTWHTDWVVDQDYAW